MSNFKFKPGSNGVPLKMDIDLMVFNAYDTLTLSSSEFKFIKIVKRLPLKEMWSNIPKAVERTINDFDVNNIIFKTEDSYKCYLKHIERVNKFIGNIMVWYYNLDIEHERILNFEDLSEIKINLLAKDATVKKEMALHF